MEVILDKIILERYAKYKDSGVEWLGEIPEHWETSRIKYLFKEINERSSNGNEELLSVSQFTGVTKKSDKVDEGDLLTNASTLEGYKKVYKNDLVSNIMLAWNGSLGFSPYDGITSPAYSIYRLNNKYNNRYFHYLLRTELYKSEFKRNSSGVIESRLRLYTDDFFNIISILPSVNEQNEVAKYLDNKTSKIDQAIAIKQKQIELLKERRQILIHNAVTRGLDKNVKFKDSGVEWIGDIPVHWKIVPFRRVSYLQQGLQISIDKRLEFPRKDALEYVTTKSLHNPNDLKHYVYNPKESVICRFDDVLLGRTGNTGEVVTNVYGVFHNNFFKIVYDREKIYKEFLVYYLNTTGIQNLIMLSAGVTTIPDLNHGDFLSLPYILIPFSDQEKISKYIKSTTDKIDMAISLKEKEIEKLKEYKNSLINSVVTGKVKIS